MKDELRVVGTYLQPVMVPTDLIVIDDGDARCDYQRGERRSFSEWNWDRYDPLRLGMRSPTAYHAVEGGHRVRQARRFGIASLPAFVFHSEGPIKEADVFVEMAKSRAGLKARERFKAAVAAGHPHETALYELLHKYHLRISDNDSWPNVRSVSCLMKTSLEAVEFSVGIVCEVWPGDADALREAILTGLCDLPDRFKRKNKVLDRDKLIAKLQVLSPLVILREGSSLAIGDRSTRFGDVFERIYYKASRRSREQALEAADKKDGG